MWCKNMNIARKLQVLMYVVLLSSIAIPMVSGQAITQITSTLCAVVNEIRTVIGFLALVLFIIGGVLYAMAHFLPSAGQIKGNMQGWAMGMVMGGIIGIIIVILAPFIVTTVTNFSYYSITAPTC